MSIIDCPAVLAYCQEDAPLAAYQAGVVTLERELVAPEVAAIREWVDSVDERAAEPADGVRSRAASHALKVAVKFRSRKDFQSAILGIILPSFGMANNE